MAARPGVYPRQLFAAVTFASIPVYCYGGIHHFGVCVVYATAGIIIAVMLVGAALWALNQHWASGRGGLGHDQPSRPRAQRRRPSARAAGHPHHRPRGPRRGEFSYLRINLELSAGNLSQHLGVLENAGLITLEKRATQANTPAPGSLSRKTGQTALADEIAQLKLLISRTGSGGTPPGQARVPDVFSA